ncbi:MAG: recombinase family protein [Lachnospiraceae bacterium]|nr:recombinase family protein [Lachnospiraceae bacterium]
MKKQNVAYLRVSTEAQTEKYGLDVQRQKIIEYCEKNNVEIDKWYIDGGYSGSNIDRPDMQALLDDSEKGLIGTVYIYKLDRMSRDVIDTLNLLHRVLPKYGVKVVSMTEDLSIENPMDKVMLTMNAAMNQYEREVIRMRMSAGMKERVKNGLWMGGNRTPFGYRYDRNDGILHVKEDEAEVVRQAYKLYIDGYSCENISKILGFKGERIVTQILKRKSNIGIIKYKGEEYKGQHEAIVDEKTFYEAQEHMKKRHTNSHIANDHILTGLCYCGVCGARMRYQKWGKYHKLCCYSQYRTGKEYMIKNPNCDNQRENANEVEQLVEECFKEFSLNIEYGEYRESKKDIIESSIKKSNAKIKKYYSLYAENESDNLLELIQEEEKRVRELKKQLEFEKENEHRNSKEKIDKIKKVSDIWDELTGKEKNMVLKEYVERIVIKNGDIDIHFIDF